MSACSLDPKDFQSCRRAALKCLARRDHCSNELRLRLTLRGYEFQTVAAVIKDLEERKLLDECTYIEHFISHYAGRGQGPDRIGRQLRILGLNFELVGQLIGQGQDWIMQAKEVRRRKFGAALPSVKEDIRKQSQFLRYRGFTTAQIRAALQAPEAIAVRFSNN